MPTLTLYTAQQTEELVFSYLLTFAYCHLEKPIVAAVIGTSRCSS